MKAEYVVKHKKEEWEDYMRSKKWMDTKDAVMERDNGLCVFCGDEAKTCHHITYVDNPAENDKVENCVSVCERCHKLIHFGKKRRLKDLISEYKLPEEAPINQPLAVEIGLVEQLPNKTMLCVWLQDIDNQYEPFTWLWNYGTKKSERWMLDTIEKICLENGVKARELSTWEDLIGLCTIVERRQNLRGPANVYRVGE